MSVDLRLILDLQGAQDPRNGNRGIGRVVGELAAELDSRAGTVAALFLNRALPIPDHFPAALLSSPRLRWNTVGALDDAMQDGPVAYHVMSPFEMGTPGPIAIPEHALRGDLPLVVTLHDLIPLHEPERLLPGALRQRYVARSELVRSADLVLCVSENTRADAVARLRLDPERCVVTGNGAGTRFRPAGDGDDPEAILAAALPQLRRPHVLCVSGGDERKNTKRLLTAYSRLPVELRGRHQLVVSCDLDPGIGRDWASHAAAAGLADVEVVFTGFVPDAVLLTLYQTAALVVMPSLDEGYGLPVAEAIACERPVVTSDAGALPEILRLQESTFDPRDEAAMARVIERGLDDGGFRSRLLEAGRCAAPQHRWPAVAGRVLDAVASLRRQSSSAVAAARGSSRSASKAPSARRHEGRLHIALVGPMPPVASGVADYNARVAAELAQHVQLDVLSPVPLQRVVPEDDGPWRRLPAQALGRTIDPSAYHALLYTVGNSYHHIATRELALRFPGVVWFHDVRLAALYRNVAEECHADDPQGWLRGVLRSEYGDRLESEGASVFDREWVHRCGVCLSQELVRSARGVVVNTHLGEQLLRLDQGPDAAVPPLLRLELAVGSPPAAPPVARAVDPPLVATFGNVDWIKAPDRLLEAVANIAPTTDARLVIVGTLANIGRAELEGSARRLGILDRVELTGEVDEPEWWRRLRQATVAVQLRRLTNGEASAAIADCLAAGTPVVTNIVNAAAEYPPEAVLAIDPDLRPGGLEEALMRLLGDRAMWERHSRAALGHARTSSFEAVVGRLLGWLETAVARPAKR